MSAVAGPRARLRALVAGLVLAASAAVGLAPTPPAQAAEDGWSATKKLERTFVNGARTLTVDERDVTVRVDRTTNLRGRERVAISWSGAHPTGGRSASPFGEEGLLQEYPVVVLQCRGVEKPRAGQEKLSPETCWTSSRMQRSQMLPATSAPWLHDLHASPEQRALKSGLVPVPEKCEDAASFATRTTPFRAADGTTYASCTADTMAPEAAVGAAFPPAEVAAFTDGNGRGEVQFEVRSNVENQSLGCSTEVDCSIVVIPIQGLSCEGPDPECRKGGQFAAGESNFAGRAIDLAVAPHLWWAESNWRGRFSVPISFGLPPDACDVMDDRAPTGFYGSELLSQAALQWSPAYCLRKDRFKFQHNRMADGAAFALMENGQAVAALVSGRHETTGADPVAYAPTAVTGFAVGYVVDRPGNAGEVGQLKLNARLVAKLITQSYPASDRGRSRPGLEKNPVSINLDPEFRALNPGLDQIARESAATLLSLSEESDVITALTSYVAQDPDARAFVAGTPDRWGMRVNPAYEDISLPRAEWPLLDDYVPPTNQECYQQNPAPYLGQVAAPVTSLRKIAEAVLDGWPNVQTKCERATTSDPWKIGRVDRQGVGTRFVLGVVGLGDAARFGLRSASLATRGGTYVAPTTSAMNRAVALATPADDGTSPFAMDMATLVKARQAYPGTLVVYTAARLRGVGKADAAKVAQFIRVSTSEGQRAGRGNGDLPSGFVPILAQGTTARLHAQAQRVARLVEAQGGAPKSSQAPAPTTGGPGSAPTGSSGVPDQALPEVPLAQADTPKADAPGEQVVTMPPTARVSSGVASRLLPLLLVGALLAGLVGAGSRLLLTVRGQR
ncbi:hypothetical protein [Nocardioides daphniae]|uniref:PBP domain-containing protein n=1 Tax=Nocardioides daphniae TaxID=402297 RepID=A0A4P7UBM0_9ACTN|nr:hypothetical protein [Nocardioides daphniae]QCC76339.1 hypothetical protein E2C04_02365 [Nocardioides daphniae]GGD07769.1 hypothetical protein GCM10007231_03120 [Nocardioides daphniae]